MRFITYLMIAVSLMGAAKQKQKIEPSYAWQLAEPLGLRLESTIDTLFENYHRMAIPWLPSKAWATTGNYGAPGQNQVFFERKPMSDFWFEDALQPWLHTTATQRFYNTRVPMTLMGHTTGGDKYSNQDRTQVTFSGNAGKRLAVGAMLDYVYSKGTYEYQADKDFTWGMSTSYTGDRYELQALFTHYDYTTKESGGITDDRYITDPAEVQGGVTRVDNKSIPTRLTSTHNNVKGTQLMMNHRYKVGFYRYERDSITDTIVGRTYVPVTSFIWTLDYKDNRHKFLNQSASEDTSFFSHTYLNLGGTDETTKWWRLRNTVGISMLEGFNRWMKMGFAVFGTHEMRRFTQVTDTVTGGQVTLLDGLDVAPATVSARHTQHLVWLGGQLTKMTGSTLRYAATAKFGMAGDVVGDVDISGDITARARLLGDTVSLRGYGYFKNQEVPYLLKNFVSNHFVWQNSFSKEKRLRLGGELNVPHTLTNVNVGYETLKNFVYFDADALPAQHSGAIHVFQATLRQGLHLKAFGWDNAVTYQTSSNKDVLALPAVSLFSNMYVKFLIAQVLHVQLGVDCNYYSKYYAPSYNPALMAFHVQNEQKCGNFALFDAYANFKLKKARFFVLYSHANAKLFGGNNYFALPHYPLNPARFQVGVSVDFAH
ncbi:MAG: putative porin [Muribaculaceae bacterium]|nr:putative porin [Muribaculaceae bacterium]